MTIKIEALGYLIDVNGAELSKVNGGYAADIVATTGNFGLASIASSFVLNQAVTDDLIEGQFAIGVPQRVVIRGVGRARREGGVFTPSATVAKLAD